MRPRYGSASPVSGHGGNGERRRECHDATHAGPPGEEHPPARRERILALARNERARTVGHERQPGQSHQDDGRAHRRHGQREGPEPTWRQVHREPGPLEPQQHEDEPVEDEDEQPPYLGGLHPGGRRPTGEEMAPHREATGDAGEHCGGAHLLAQDPGYVGRQHRQGDVAHAVARQARHEVQRECHRDADRDAAQRVVYEVAERAAYGELAGDTRGDGRGVEHQRAGVVQEALALELGDERSRNAEASCHRRGRDGVGRGHDCAEDVRRRPGNPRHREVGHPRHRDGCCHHQPDRQRGDRRGAAPQLPQVALERGGPQYRGQEDGEDQFRSERRLGQARHETHGQSAEHQHDGIGNGQAARERAERQHERQEQHDELQDRLRGAHAASVPRRPVCGSRPGTAAPQAAGKDPAPRYPASRR